MLLIEKYIYYFILGLFFALVGFMNLTFAEFGLGAIITSICFVCLLDKFHFEERSAADEDAITWSLIGWLFGFLAGLIYTSMVGVVLSYHVDCLFLIRCFGTGFISFCCLLNKKPKIMLFIAGLIFGICSLSTVLYMWLLEIIMTDVFILSLFAYCLGYFYAKKSLS